MTAAHRPTAASADRTALVPLSPALAPGVRAVFRATLGLGRPLPFDLADGGAYERLCLDWYLGPGAEDAAVVVRGGEVVGYALVCVDDRAHGRATRRAAVAWLARAPFLLRPRVDRRARDFVRWRIADGWPMLTRRAAHGAEAHAHVNLLPEHRTLRWGRHLVAHVDRRVRAAGGRCWYGEINARAGRRAAALARYGGHVVDRRPNRTFTWLAGEPVERLTVVRDAVADPSPLSDRERAS